MKLIRRRPWTRIRRLRTDADLEEELRIHLEMHSEDNLAAGMSHPEAQRRARACSSAVRAPSSNRFAIKT